MFAILSRRLIRYVVEKLMDSVNEAAIYLYRLTDQPYRGIEKNLMSIRKPVDEGQRTSEL